MSAIGQPLELKPHVPSKEQLLPNSVRPPKTARCLHEVLARQIQEGLRRPGRKRRLHPRLVCLHSTPHITGSSGFVYTHSGVATFPNLLP